MITFARLSRLYPNSKIEFYDRNGRPVSYKDSMNHDKVIRYECSQDNTIIHVYLKGE